MMLQRTGVLVAAFALLLGTAACSTPSSSSSGAAANTTSSSAADCPLVGAADPGNATAPSDVSYAEKAPKLQQKDSYTVAFSQNASNNPWRLAETASMQDEAKKLGIKLTVTDANNDQAKQIQDVRSLIAQKPDMLFIAPITEQLANVVKEAADAGIPVILLDRQVDESVAIPGESYVTVISSDFVQEGKRAAWAMANATNGSAKIIELEGTTGSSPANDRKKGFDDDIKQCPGMEIIASQDADFARATGQQVAETLLQAHPEATAIYAHNDEMALGAIAAIKAMGKVPGKDIQVVSIDGEKDGVSAVAAGEMFATVECNPRFGPSAFDTMMKYAAGEKIPTVIINPDQFYDSSNAAAAVDGAF